MGLFSGIGKFFKRAVNPAGFIRTVKRATNPNGLVRFVDRNSSWLAPVALAAGTIATGGALLPAAVGVGGKILAGAVSKGQSLALDAPTLLTDSVSSAGNGAFSFLNNIWQGAKEGALNVVKDEKSRTAVAGVSSDPVRAAKTFFAARPVLGLGLVGATVVGVFAFTKRKRR